MARRIFHRFGCRIYLQDPESFPFQRSSFSVGGEPSEQTELSRARATANCGIARSPRYWRVYCNWLGKCGKSREKGRENVPR